MSKYLDMLKRQNSEKRPPPLLQKLQKAPFDTFCSSEGGHFQEKTAEPEVLAPSPDHRTLIQTDAAVAAAARAYHNHLFGPGRSTGCCAARHGRYCDTGGRLREAYHLAHRMAEERK